MQISTAYSSTSLSLLGQTSQLSTTLKTAQVPASRDQVQVSEQALESSRKAGRGEAQASTPTLQLLGDLVSLVSGQDLEGISELPTGEIAAGLQQTSIAAESVSLSLGGTISTRDGKELGFNLDLQYDHAALDAQSALVEAGSEGISFSYAGVAAELTSTSFSFTMSAAGDSGPRGGKGSLHLNDEVSSIGKELKPLAKEFMDATGMRGGWGAVNRFLRSIT